MSKEAIVGFCDMPKEIFQSVMWEKEDLVVEDKVYQCVVSPVSKKKNAAQINLSLMLEDKVLTFMDLNNKLKTQTVQAYLHALEKSLIEVLLGNYEWVDESDRDVSFHYGTLGPVEEGTPVEATNLRIVLMMKDTLPLLPEEEEAVRKKLKLEFANWVDQVIHDKPFSLPKEAYEKEFKVLVNSEILPHEKPEYGMDSTMTIFALLFAVLGFLFMEWFFFQIIAIVVAGCTSFRAFQHKRYICAGLCILAIVMGLVASAISYAELKQNMEVAATQITPKAGK